MTKLTPAKRIKQLKANGWLEFVEFMETAKISPKDLCYTPTYLKEFSRGKTLMWLAQDVEYDLYRPSGPNEFVHLGKVKMNGLSEQVTTKPKNNKMVKRGKYS